MDKDGSKDEVDAERAYIEAARPTEEELRYARKSRRFRKEVLTPRKHNGVPVQVDIVILPSQVRDVAVELDSSMSVPYDLAKLRKSLIREKHTIKAPLVRYINFAIQSDPRFKGFRPISEIEFCRLVFVRRRRATPVEAWRYACMGSNDYQNVGLPVGMTLGEIRRRIAVSHGFQAPMWREFWRDVLPHIRQHGRENLAKWWAAKHGKAES